MPATDASIAVPRLGGGEMELWRDFDLFRPVAKECPPMPGETDLHKTLKKEACRWLFRMGYRCIAAEVRLKPLGIIDAVGTGIFRPYHNYLFIPKDLPQVCFIECKASRSDFLRDCSGDGQMSLCLMERDRNRKSGKRRRRSARPLRQAVGLGKFEACLLQPMANIHYVLAPAGIIQKKDLPPRWGLLSFGEGGISVVVKPEWQEAARTEYVESAIARTLTGDIYRADDRAIGSVNREIFAQQQKMAERIRAIKPQIVLAPEGVGGDEEPPAQTPPQPGPPLATTPRKAVAIGPP
jgi:hypothetical protein